MKRLLIAPALALILSACVIVVDDGGGGSLTVTNITFSSDFRAVINGVERPVICDNTFTPTQVSFNYSGDLSTWRVSFRGTSTNTLVTVGDFARGDGKHTESPIGKINMNITFGNGTAPLKVKPQAIVVVPVPQQIGTSNLVITIRNSAGQSKTGEFPGLPVINNCS